MSSRTRTRSRSESHIYRSEVNRFEFLVCDWSLMPKAIGESIRSQVFIAEDDSKWQLRVYPGGFSNRQNGFVSIEVVLIDQAVGKSEDEDIIVCFALSALPAHGDTVERFDKMSTNSESLYLNHHYSFKSPDRMIFNMEDPNNRIWAIDTFLLTEELESKYLANDAVIFALNCVTLGKPSYLQSAMPLTLEGVIPTLPQQMAILLVPTHCESNGGDIILVSGSVKVRCHRYILASRSDFFKKKFTSHSFNLKLFFNSGYYFIKVEPAVLPIIIKFLYSNDLK